MEMNFPMASYCSSFRHQKVYNLGVSPKLQTSSVSRDDLNPQFLK
jgi:hypothetical protein